MAKKTCHNCKERFDGDDLTTAGRKVGGSYRRAASMKECLICEGCARRLFESVQDGHLSVSQWGKYGLKRAVEDFDIWNARKAERLASV